MAELVSTAAVVSMVVDVDNPLHAVNESTAGSRALPAVFICSHLASLEVFDTRVALLRDLCESGALRG